MKKLLKPVDILKLGMAEALDIFEELNDPLGLMSRGCELLYGWVPPRYQKRNFSRVLLRSLKTGDIRKVVKNQEVYLRLTSQGKEKLKRDFPLLVFSKEKMGQKMAHYFL